MSNPKYLTNEMIEELVNENSDEADIYSDSEDEYEPIDEEDISSEKYTSEEDSSDGEIPIEFTESTSAMIAKDGMVWKSSPVPKHSGRLRNENVLSLRPGVTRIASSRVNDKKDAFLLFFTPAMEKIIIENSNKYAQAKFPQEYIEINREYLHAYIGVLILSGVFK